MDITLIKNELLELYKSTLNYLDDDNYCIYRECPKSESCWQNYKQYLPNYTQTIYFPWVGSKYNKYNDILVVGVNYNGQKGVDFSCRLKTQAVKEINEGKKRLFKKNDSGNKYGGSTVWYFIPFIGTVFSALKGGNEFDFKKQSYLEPNLVSSGFDYIAFTNIVKCSPDTKRAKPCDIMYENCLDILSGEITILKPKIIVSFTFSWGNWFPQKLSKSLNLQITKVINNMDRSKITFIGKEYILFEINHPLATCLHHVERCCIIQSGLRRILGDKS